MPNTPYLAFKQNNQSLINRLISEVEIFGISSNIQGKMKIKALWDTGAEGSVITPQIAQSLSLTAINKVRVAGVNNVSWVDEVRVSIGLPNTVIVDDIKVMVCGLVQDIDVLIGMDIILRGDLSISNGHGKTLFSFAMPPFDRKTDLYKKAALINKRNY